MDLKIGECAEYRKVRTAMVLLLDIYSYNKKENQYNATESKQNNLNKYVIYQLLHKSAKFPFQNKLSYCANQK